MGALARLLANRTARETLLGRAERELELDGPLAWLAGRTVLLTGAAGSVGSGLAPWLLARGVGRLVLVDNHEHTLFRLHSALGDDPRVVVSLADVRNMRKLRALLAAERPQVVIHLAAYKHVPLGESSADELVAVNVLATRDLLIEAAAAGVESFVYPSSDKAVCPPSAYGATKRLGELLTHDAPAPLRASVVRFVNILGTRGSVIESFARQIAAGAPLGITDPRMTRFWMSIEEAAGLLALAAATAPAGGTWLLDPGEAVAVQEIGVRLAALLAPGASPRFSVQGTRPGERLTECLVAPTETLQPAGPRHLLAVVHRAEPGLFPVLRERVARLESLLYEVPAARLTRELVDAARALV